MDSLARHHSQLRKKSRQVGLTHVEYSKFLNDWYNRLISSDNNERAFYKTELALLISFLDEDDHSYDLTIHGIKPHFMVARLPTRPSQSNKLSKFYGVLYQFLSSLYFSSSKIEIILAKILKTYKENARILYSVHPPNLKGAHVIYDTNGMTFCSLREPPSKIMKIADLLKQKGHKVRIIQQLFPEMEYGSVTQDDIHGTTLFI